MDVAAFEGLETGSLLPPRLAAGTLGGGQATHRATLPLPTGALVSVFESGDDVVVAPLVAEAGGVRRALPGDGAFEGILEAIRVELRLGGFRGVRWTESPTAVGERTIEVDQSNDSVVVGDTAVVKLFPRTAVGPQPGLDVPAHLAAVGFEETPTPIGALVWTDDEGRDALLATAAGYLPGARDGWDWFVELVEAAAVGDAAWGQAEAPADAIGGLVARLHRALATPSTVFRSPVGTADAATWQPGAEATLAEALARTDGVAGERLAELAPAAAAAIELLASIGPTPTMRIHGDLHVGQVLRWDGGDAVSDFDGNPLATLGSRTTPGPAARDIASMTCAIDHIGRIVARRHPEADADIQSWARDARARFLGAYRAGLGHDAPELFDERLLFPLEVAQECHEFVYAARYIPRWRFVPEAALPALLEAGP